MSCALSFLSSFFTDLHQKRQKCKKITQPSKQMLSLCAKLSVSVNRWGTVMLLWWICTSARNCTKSVASSKDISWIFVTQGRTQTSILCGNTLQESFQGSENMLEREREKSPGFSLFSTKDTSGSLYLRWLQVNMFFWKCFRFERVILPMVQ